MAAAVSRLTQTSIAANHVRMLHRCAIAGPQASSRDVCPACARGEHFPTRSWWPDRETAWSNANAGAASMPEINASSATAHVAPLERRRVAAVVNGEAVGQCEENRRKCVGRARAQFTRSDSVIDPAPQSARGGCAPNRGVRPRSRDHRPRPLPDRRGAACARLPSASLRHARAKRPEPLDRTDRRRTEVGDDGIETRRLSPQELVEQLLLALEVAVEAAFADCRLGAHVVHCELGVGLPCKASPRRIDDPLSAACSLGIRDSRHRRRITSTWTLAAGRRGAVPFFLPLRGGAARCMAAPPSRSLSLQVQRVTG